MKESHQNAQKIPFNANTTEINKEEAKTVLCKKAGENRRRRMFFHNKAKKKGTIQPWRI